MLSPISQLEAAALSQMAADRGPSPTLLHGEEMAAQFSGHLKVNKELREHLTTRGITLAQMASGQVGYCPPYVDHWFPLLRGRIIVPIRDAGGRIVAFGGRIWDPMAPIVERVLWDRYGHKPADAQKRIDQWKRGKWLNEPYPKSKYLFHMDRARKSARELGFVVLVEGYMDALVLAAHGIHNVVALCGTRLTERHAATIFRYCEKVVVLLDGDEAGMKATEHIVPRLVEAAITPYILALPMGRDPDEICLQFGGSKLFRILLARIAAGGSPEHVVNLTTH